MVAGRLVGDKGSHSAPVLVHRNLSPTTMQSPLVGMGSRKRALSLGERVDGQRF